MKKIFNKLGIITTTLYLNITTVFAKNPSAEELLKRPTGDSTEIKAANNLPDVSANNLIADIIKEILKWTFSISVLAIVVAGFYYLTAQGEDEQTTKAKEILKYLIIGLLVISAAYGIVSGIAEFNFFKTRI